MHSAHQYAQPTVRARTSNATPCVDPSNTAGGTTAAAAAMTGLPAAVFNSACSTFPAIDAAVAENRVHQKKRTARRVGAPSRQWSCVQLARVGEPRPGGLDERLELVQ
jgi:hypothetical protein